METSGLLRHKIIENLITPHTEKVADIAIILWEQMAAKIIPIVGEGGFNSLYVRSVFLIQPTFPWLTTSAQPPQTGQRFAALKVSLERQAPALAAVANNQLLITFTDILASLIGEQLTTRILRSAWGNDASDQAGKESKNE